MPRLSVIVPVRNGGHYVKRAVQSTLLALPADASVHVMDDCSTDDTVEQLEQINDRRLVVLLKKQKEPGLCAVLNELLARTDSEYVARMDADDIALPWRFRQQSSYIETHGLDFTFAPVIRFNRRKVSPQRFIGLDPASFSRALLLTNPVAHSTMYAKREPLTALGGYRQVQSEDYDLWLRAAVRGYHLGRSSVPCLLYRVHAGQVTSKPDWSKAAVDEDLLRQSHQALSAELLGCQVSSLVGLRAPSIASADLIAETRQLISAVRSDSAASNSQSSKQLRRIANRAESVLSSYLPTTRPSYGRSRW